MPCRMTPDRTIDCAGLLCPLPVLRARKALIAMAPGAVLEVIATDRMAAIDLPHFCTERGHIYLGATVDDAVTRHLIRRGPLAPAAQD
jgi:tRNA 2-thiouridine synthesizing protein A